MPHQAFDPVITQITDTTLMSMMHLLVMGELAGFYVQANLFISITERHTFRRQTVDLFHTKDIKVTVIIQNMFVDFNFVHNIGSHLQTFLQNLKQPVLGICLGMQLMCRHSEEGNADCLGIFDTDVKLFSPTRHEDKVPHMGWNTLTHVRSDLFKGFTKEEFVYFVHSFYVPLNEFTAAQTDYILPYSSALHKDNFYATQFHPEKSGAVGERILRNFLEL